MASESRLGAIEDRLQRLEDREAIRALRHEYSYAIDAQDWDRFLSLFTDDARIEFPQDSVDHAPVQGKDELEAFCSGLEQRRFTAHMMHNAVLEVEGNEASGTWYFEVPEVVEDGSAVWVQGRYEEEYERVDGAWKFSRIQFYFNYNVDYDDGWAGQIIDDA